MSRKQKIDFNDIYNNLVEVLSVVFLNKQTINAIKTDLNVEKAVIDLLSICNQLELKLNIINENKKINEFKSAFETISGKKTKLSKVNINDESNILDKINYLKVILKNSHNLDWITILNSLNYKSLDKDDNEQVVNAEKTDINFNHNYQETYYKDSADFLKQNNISIDEITDNIIKQQAINLLNSDIVSNKFYQFDSKPKIFKIFKYLVLGLWLLSFLTFFLLMIFGFILRNKFFVFDQSYINNSITYEAYAKGFGSKWWGIDNSLITWLLPTILIVVSLLFVIHFIFNQIKYFKNDNIQYAFKSSISWFYIIFVLIYILFPIFSSVNNSILTIFKNVSNNDIKGTIEITNIPNHTDSVTFNIDNRADFPILQAYYVLTIFCIVLAGVVLIATIVMMVIKPKLDTNRINKKIEEYYKDIKSGKIRVNNDYSGAGGGIFGNSPWRRNPFSPW